MKTESSTLAFSAFMALLIGCAGIVATLASNSQAILLDGLFNLIYFSVALVTIKVSKLASRPDSESYPFGYSYFESLVNLCKGLLILGGIHLRAGRCRGRFADGWAGDFCRACGNVCAVCDRRLLAHCLGHAA